MPLLERTCANGHRWEDLVGVGRWPEALECPTCGERTVGNVPGGFTPDVCGIERMDAAEIRLGLEHRADLERNAEGLRSGALRVNQSGRVPLEMRPRIERRIY